MTEFAPMPARPTWQGHLRLSLVSCPVILYNAVSPAAEVRFHLLNPETGSRIRMIPTDPDTGPVDRSDLVRGFEVERGQYVTVSEEEIRSVRLESTRTLDIERFVDVEEIDRIYWNDPFYLVPDGKMATEAFSVIREAMREAGRVALGRLVLHTRERLMALEPRDEGLIAWSLRSHDEVRSDDALFDSIPDVEPPRPMVEIAARIIEQLEGPFDPTAFVDRYEEALKALVDSKIEGRPLTPAPAAPDTPAGDLMEALKRSLQRGAPPPARKAPAKRSSRRAPGKPARRKAS